MVRSQKQKRVTWASDLNLCQVRLFLSEDPPSQAGLGAQDNLQVKASWLLHSTGVGFDDQLPPGFEGAHSTDQLKEEVSQMPQVKWQCPPKFVPNPHWQVVDGEESKEAEVQMQREMRVMEAIYPRPSAIPPSPSVSSEVEHSHFEDNQVPRIPITPIEDEDATHSPSDSTAATNNSVNSPLHTLPHSWGEEIPQKAQSNILTAPKSVGANEISATGVVPGVEPDVVAAASAAFTAIMRSNEEGSLIDQELLIKILSNPKLIEKLVTDYGTSANNPRPVAMPRSLLMNMSGTQSGPPGYTNTPLPAAPISGVFHHVTNVAAPSLHPPPPPGIVNMSGPAVKPPPVKDMSYYKSLIQLHGGEKPEAQDQGFPQFVNHHHLGTKTEQLQSSTLREPKTKNKRACLYFNSSRGCKNGVNCTYHHDMSAPQRIGNMPEAQSAKRMKVDREIIGRT